MKASKRTTLGDDLNSNFLGGRERAEGGGMEPENLNMDIVTPPSRSCEATWAARNRHRREGVAAGEEGRI